eukprot:163121_1
MALHLGKKKWDCLMNGYYKSIIQQKHQNLPPDILPLFKLFYGCNCVTWLLSTSKLLSDYSNKATIRYPYLTWNSFQILEWIMNLENGSFMQYKEILQTSLTGRNITGADLANVTQYTVSWWTKNHMDFSTEYTFYKYHSLSNSQYTLYKYIRFLIEMPQTVVGPSIELNGYKFNLEYWIDINSNKIYFKIIGDKHFDNSQQLISSLLIIIKYRKSEKYMILESRESYCYDDNIDRNTERCIAVDLEECLKGESILFSVDCDIVVHRDKDPKGTQYCDIEYEWKFNENVLQKMSECTDDGYYFYSPDNFGNDVNLQFYLVVSCTEDKFRICLCLLCLPYKYYYGWRFQIDNINVILKPYDMNDKRKIWRQKNIDFINRRKEKAWKFNKSQMLRDLSRYSLVIELRNIHQSEPIVN